MVEKRLISAPRLLPARHSQKDLFFCDVADAALKDVIQHMEHPFYALSKKPDAAIRRYEYGNVWIEITPSVKGMPTIWDKDILIYAISAVVHARKRGESPSQKIRINCREFLTFSNRGTAGKDYDAMCAAVARLAGVQIETNVRTGDIEERSVFSMIDAASVRRKHGLSGRLLWVEVKLSDWLWNAIHANEVLTLHPDYFRLRRPIERRLYEIARKHCGQQARWSCSIKSLYRKSGSHSPLKHFRYLLRSVEQHKDFPDYIVEHTPDDQVLFINRNTMPLSEQQNQDRSLRSQRITDRLSGDVFETARAAAPGWDIYYLAKEFGRWWDKVGTGPVRSWDALFVKFCHSWHRQHPAPR